jgi:hypothetical protein
MKQNIKSKAEFFRLAANQNVERVQVGGISIDEWDEWVIEARKQLEEQGAKPEDIIETDTQLEVKGSCNYWTKPKNHRKSTGKLVNRSADFYFESDNLDRSGETRQSFGQQKDLKLIDNKLVLTMFNGAEIHYSLQAV